MFLQDNQPRSFHARFYPHGESPSFGSSGFHLLEDDDMDKSMPWHIKLVEDTSYELAGDVSREEPFTKMMHSKGSLYLVMELKFLLLLITISVFL